jgi:peptidoglycan-N-acetylglucosamine deacetylase
MAVVGQLDGKIQDSPMTTLAPSTPAVAATPWPLPPFLKLSVGLHAAALLLLMLQPSAWPWWLAAVVLNHAVITITGLLPRSHWLGDNVTRLPAACAARGEWALTIDDGPDPDLTPWVLDVLDQHQARATFFCIATQAQAHPALVQAIVARGHSVQNHSHSHPHTFSFFGRGRIARELAQAQQTLTQLTGVAPRYFRAPAGLRNPFLAPVLHRLGLRLVAWTQRGYDTREARAEVVLQRLTSHVSGGSILLLHDGHSARNAQGRAVLLDVLPALLQAANARGLRTVTLPQALDPVMGKT